MTLQALNTIISWPGFMMTNSGSPTFGTSTLLDAAGEYDCIVICAQEDMVISHVALRGTTGVGSPTADIRIETVDPATGLPSGTLWATNTNVVTPALASTWVAHALTAAATITKGQVFAVKIAFNSGTSFNTVTYGTVGSGGILRSLPYRVVNVGTPTKSAIGSSNFIAMALGSSSTVFYKQPLGLMAINGVSQTGFNNSSSAIRGARFKVPFKCRAVGLRHYMGSAVGDFNALIMDDSGAELSSSSTAFEGDVLHPAGASLENYFDNPVTLDPDTWYRVGIQPSSTTNCSIMTCALPSADYRTAMPGGLNYYYTAFTGSWTDDTAVHPMMEILIDQFDDGAGGGVVAHVIGG